MTITIHDKIDQNTDAWYELRLGIPTASCFKDILAKGEGKVRKTYIYRLAGERLSGKRIEGYSNFAIERGHEQEDQARRDLMMMADIDPDTVKEVGFVTNHNKLGGGLVGASPDALVIPKRGIEIKTMRPDLLLKLHDDERSNAWIPTEHVAQVQGNMWVCECDSWEFAIYSPKIKLFWRTVKRDNAYIEELARAVASFQQELDELVKRHQF